MTNWAMEHYLVLTAVGTDRPDIVNQLTHLISDCGCNIVDSRMALFGAEFSLIMMISGNWNAITRFETSLPLKSQQLDLMTVVKRTTAHPVKNCSDQVTMKVCTRDSSGIIGHFTQFISDHQLILRALRSNIRYSANNAIPILEAEFIAHLPEDVDQQVTQQAFATLCQSLGVKSSEFSITPIQLS